jgi:hypothetical protein
MTTQDKGTPIDVQVKVSLNDFESLYVQSMNWQDTDWAAQDGRFTPILNYTKWERAYWFDLGLNLIIAKAFLTASNVEFSEHIDTYDDDSWVLLTNFGGKL